MLKASELKEKRTPKKKKVVPGLATKPNTVTNHEKKKNLGFN